MANVKGVILNGAKYESQDTEARTLVGQAINQVETLENTVTGLESGFANLGETVANVNQTATNAKTTADNANTLAQQAETRAQSAYELADSIGHQVGVLHDYINVPQGSSVTLSAEQENQLFPFIKEGKADGKSFLLNIWAFGTRNNEKNGWILFSVSGSTIMFRVSFLNNVSVSYTNNQWEITNNSDTAQTVVLSATMQP